MAEFATKNILEIFISTCWPEGDLDADTRTGMTQSLTPKILKELENFKQSLPKAPVVVPIMPAGGTGKVLQKVLEATGEVKKRGPIKGTTNRYQIFLKECCDWEAYKKAHPAVTYPQFKTLMGVNWKIVDDAKTPEAKATSDSINTRKEAFENWLLANPGKKYADYSKAVPMPMAVPAPIVGAGEAVEAEAEAGDADAEAEAGEAEVGEAEVGEAEADAGEADADGADAGEPEKPKDGPINVETPKVVAV